MDDKEIEEILKEETPVDEIRRIRERHDREAGGDITKLIEMYRKAAAPYMEKLGLKRVSTPPPRFVIKDGTEG